MPRKRRFWEPGTIYHVMNRGTNHQLIFRDWKDYEKNLEILAYVKEKYPYKLHAYCLMPNHYHLLLETEDTHIAEIMKLYGQTYTLYFNHKYDQDGALFRGRYHSMIVQSDSYFLQASRYIHENPVKANMVLKAEDYPWSSFRYYVDPRVESNLITESRTLLYFDDPPRVNYADFVHCHEDNEYYNEILNWDEVNSFS